MSLRSSIYRSVASIKKHHFTNPQLYCAFHKKIMIIEKQSPSKTSLLQALKLERDKYYKLKNDKDPNYTKNNITGSIDVNCGINNNRFADEFANKFIEKYIKINQTYSSNRGGKTKKRKNKRKNRKSAKKRFS